MFRTGLRAWVFALAALALSTPGQGQYPAKPIRLLVGFPAGGGVDVTTRIIAPKMSEILGQPVVVENKPGAAGVTAMSELVRSAPDGYTLVVGNVGQLAIAPNMMASPPYDALRDFTPLGQIVTTYVVLVVSASHPARSLTEFVAWAKANAAPVTFASGGNGSISHLAGELVSQVANVRMTHVPYKGAMPAMTDVMAGHADVLVENVAALAPHVKSGRLRALAVTGPNRNPELPAVPTVSEAGFPQLDVSAWQGLLGPAGMRPDVIRKLTGALHDVLAMPDVRDRLSQAGTPVTERDADQFAAFMKSESQAWKEIIRRSGARIE